METNNTVANVQETVKNKKSAATEVTAQKTQTPIVAKLIMQNGINQTHNGICVFIKFTEFGE